MGKAKAAGWARGSGSLGYTCAGYQGQEHAAPQLANRKGSNPAVVPGCRLTHLLLQHGSQRLAGQALVGAGVGAQVAAGAVLGGHLRQVGRSAYEAGRHR